MVHLDQANTYASKAHQQLIQTHQLICSLNRKGECLDNAVAESVLGTLKTEWVDHEDYHTKVEVK